MKYYIISGEASGDLHGSNLIKELKKNDKEADFRCWGGDLMIKQGVAVVKHIKELAFMGFVEVLMNIRTIKKNFSFCYKDILDYKPDVLILIDYPGFNLRVAKFAHHNNIRVFYYISPQVWAWKQSRVYKIKKFVDKMFVILPFEKDFYRNFNYDVDFVGHPLLDCIEADINNKTSFENFVKTHNLDDKPIVALLPGSRKQEIKRKLPLMLDVAKSFSDYQFVIAAAPSVDINYYHSFGINDNIKMVRDATYRLLQHAKAALVTSGTATLETALFEVPEIVCYKSNILSYIIAKKLVKVKYISLVNLIMDKPVVKELIQSELNITNLTTELNKILYDNTYIEGMTDNYQKLKNKLGGQGASGRTAKLIMEYLQNGG